MNCVQLPENVVQIGEPDEFYKVFIEDYVYTYIRQFEREPYGKRIRLYLFGKALSGEQTGYFYIYGAADSEKGILSTQHEFFPDYDIVGIMSLYHGEKEISLQNGTVFPLAGYFVFYEQNEAMQSFLVHNYHQKEEAETHLEKSYSRKEPEKGNREIYQSRTSYRKQTQVIKEKDTKGEGLYIFASSVAIIICIIAITTINRYDEMQGFNNDVLQAIHMEGQEQDTALTATDINIEEIYETEALTSGEPEVVQESAEIHEEVSATIEENITTEESNVETEESYETQSEPEKKETLYTIKQGDTLQKICRSYYGSEELVKAVCERNHIDNPDNIIQGQKIVLP